MVGDHTDPRGTIPSLRERLEQARGFLDLESKETEMAELRDQAAEPGLWDNPNRARSITQKLDRYARLFDLVGSLAIALDDAEVLVEFGDNDSMSEASVLINDVAAQLDRLELESLYFGEYDDSNAIVTIYAGAGGVEAADWAEMLYRMYERFLTSKGFELTQDDITYGEEAGIKSVTMTVVGDRAYGTLESERGTHRLVRISPFDANARRHTSFAGVDVVPDLGEEADVEVKDDDIRVDTFRSQGAGGQHVNKTDSAVRITHFPSGIVVSVQNERSQLQNRNRAMAILKAKLAHRAREAQMAQYQEIRGENEEAAWGRQIRSYVLQPYQMVKDLRTELEIGNVSGVLDGDLEALVESYLRWRRGRYEEAIAGG